MINNDQLAVVSGEVVSGSIKCRINDKRGL